MPSINMCPAQERFSVSKYAQDFFARELDTLKEQVPNFDELGAKTFDMYAKMDEPQGHLKGDRLMDAIKTLYINVLFTMPGKHEIDIPVEMPIAAIMEEYDSDKSGSITFDEFRMITERLFVGMKKYKKGRRWAKILVAVSACLRLRGLYATVHAFMNPHYTEEGETLVSVAKDSGVHPSVIWYRNRTCVPANPSNAFKPGTKLILLPS